MSGGFLERWSRRKTDEGQTEPPTAAQDEAAAQVTEGVDEPLLSDEELAALPRIEDLTPESSLAPFLRAGVPHGLKNAAMRRMWLLTPAIRDHKDCAVDYHWDWNTPGGVPGNGGRLNPEAVQKMLRGLSGPPKVTPPNEAAQPQPAPETTPEPAARGGETPAEGSAQPAPPPSPASPADAAFPAEPAFTERRRRHGGAMPG